jgi:tetratricopeptide (TPR) repeat protein
MNGDGDDSDDSDDVAELPVQTARQPVAIPIFKKKDIRTKKLAFFSEEEDVDEVLAIDAGTYFVNSDEMMEQGNALASSGSYASALTRFDAALRCLPAYEVLKQAILNESRAQCLLALEQDFEAVKSAQLATTLAPNWPDGWLTLGRSQLEIGEPSLALRSFAQVLSLDSANYEVQEDLARALRMQQMLDDTGGDGRAASHLSASRSTIREEFTLGGNAAGATMLDDVP